MIVDIEFSIMASELPVDHGYLLYGAISRLLPELHGRRGLGIHPIGGSTLGCPPRFMRPHKHSLLRLRASDELSPLIVKLAGKKLALGEHPLRVGVPRVRPLTPAPELKSRLVTIKGFAEPDSFREAVERQLAAMEVVATVVVGKRRTTSIAGKEIVGYQVALQVPNPTHSITVQEIGIGGRRPMGCGLFDPVA